MEGARWRMQDSGACAYEQAEEGRVYAGRTQAMPAFPAQDCCQMIDGTLVVKLSAI